MGNMLLRTRINLVSGAVILLVVAIMTVALLMVKQEADKRYSKHVLSSKQALWQEILAGDYNAMEAELFSITRNRDALRAIAAADRDFLATALQPTYNRLSASEVISALLVADKDTRLLYPASYSIDSSTSELIASAIRDGKLKTGLVRDGHGKLASMFVVPLYERPGQVIGAGVFLRDLQTALVDFSKSDQSAVYIINNAGHLDHATNKDLFNRLSLDTSSLSTVGFSVVSAGEHAYAVSRQPLLDAEQKQLAIMVSIMDYTESYRVQQNITVGVTITVIGLLVVAMVAVYWYMRRALSPLQRVANIMSRIAKGDLTNKIDVTSRDEIGQLMGAVAEMSDRLHVMVNDVRQTTDVLGTTAGKMKHFTEQTRVGVERQSGDTEQVATAMNEMTSTVQEVARHASQAAASAEQADVSAKDGERVVKDSIQSINELAQKIEHVSSVINQLKSESEAITTVVVVIKDIAEQTNLLALNAAIEAARAGEQGRGFAVVADEVRNLASRTQSSTKEIQEMIERLQEGANQAVVTMESSRQQAQASVQLAKSAGESLQAITRGVASISEMNMQIAAAAEEQTSVSEEINRNIVNISHVAEQTSHGAQETEMAGSEVSRVAQHLQGLVQQFQLHAS